MELEIRFPTHGVMNAFGFLYPQYWLQLDCDASFTNHLQVLKVVFCCGKTMCKVNEKEVQVQEFLKTDGKINCMFLTQQDAKYPQQSYVRGPQ
jgi:hypothetical protein